MIPSLVMIRSEKKFLFAFTQKRILKIGADASSDIVVNHPDFYERPQVLSPGLEPVTPEKKDQRYAPSILPTDTCSMDGISVRLINLKRIFSLLVIAGLLFFPLAFYFFDVITPSTQQDWTPVRLPAEGVYGYCRQDRRHREGVRLSFEANQSQPYRLLFLPGGRGDGTTITLSLNGKPINKPMLLPEGWGEEKFIRLPAASILKGNNTVEVRPKSKSVKYPRWGISEVRVVPIGHPRVPVSNDTILEPDSILAMLDERDIDGPELAHYYEKVSSWDVSRKSESFSHDREKALRKIEERMRDKLHRIAIDVRSKNIQGDRSAVQHLLNETSGWIPGTWSEGWEIFNEFCL